MWPGMTKLRMPEVLPRRRRHLPGARRQERQSRGDVLRRGVAWERSFRWRMLRSAFTAIAFRPLGLSLTSQVQALLGRFSNSLLRDPTRIAARYPPGLSFSR